ncbi:helix-turn-helix domain-containing protein [Rhizobium sophoriradicis]|nr:helix-turn-helix domain-containing protein [Rhizobium sophoriradicis]UWU35457.1 helix-turn-helix domain-containing protein [Rhizobium leguminosarum bv. phaseoli]
MEERVRVLSDYVSGHWSVSDLCRRYGVSRETFYAWRQRQMSGADDWFVDRSHGTVSCPHRTPAALVDQVIALRQRFPHMGPRKLLALLQRQSAQTPWPAASTIGDILKRAGLVETSRRRRRALDQGRPFSEARQANDEWSVGLQGLVPHP